MIDWRMGYSSTWRVFRVGTDTWADSTELRGVSSVSIERTCDEDAPILERGSMSVDMDPSEQFEEGYYRVVMTATQNGISERVEVATMLCSSTSFETNRNVAAHDIECRSVLYPASVTLADVGGYAPKGVDAVQYVASMLEGCINAPVETEGSFTLDDHYVFDEGSYVLQAVWKLLDAGSYVIQITGGGIVRIVPKPTEPSLMLDHANARLLHNGVSGTLDYSEIHNRYYASDNGVVAVAVNDDPTSITSTVRRGWTSDEYDSSPTRVNGETLQAYAERKLEEQSLVTDDRTYVREFSPDVLPYSVVHGSMELAGLSGDMRVVSQSLECGRGITVTENARREVYTWRRA